MSYSLIPLNRCFSANVAHSHNANYNPRIPRQSAQNIDADDNGEDGDGDS